jgi:hypothetical protein
LDGANITFEIGQRPRGVHLQQSVEAFQLALQIAVEAPEIAETCRLEVHFVQPHQGVDEFLADSVGRVLAEPWREGVTQDVSLDVGHDVERRADHALVLAHH